MIEFLIESQTTSSTCSCTETKTETQTETQSDSILEPSFENQTKVQVSNLRQSIKIGDQEIRFISAPYLLPIIWPIQCIFDETLNFKYFPKIIRTGQFNCLKWSKLSKCGRSPQWKKKNIPIAVLSAKECNLRRKTILQMCQKANTPIILFFPRAEENKIKANQICDENMYLALNVSENVIIFTWNEQMTLEQEIVLEYLLRNWQDIPLTARNYLKSLTFIPDYRGIYI